VTEPVPPELELGAQPIGPLTEARGAQARHDWQACYDMAGELACDEPLLDAERLDLLAEAAWWLGRLEECIAARQAAYDAYNSCGEPRRAGMCAVWLYQDHCLRGRPAAGSGWLQRARRALDDDTSCFEYGALLLREAEVAHGDGRLDEADQLAERARTLGRSLPSTDLEAEALQTLGRLHIDAGRPVEGLRQLDEAMLLAVEGKLGPYATGKVYCSMISACEELGDLRRAAEWTEATASWAARHPYAIFPGICRVHRAVVLDRRGALEEAEREATRACGELLNSHLPNAVSAYAHVGDIRRRLGDLDGAEEAFARVRELSGRDCAGTALLRLAQGDLNEAHRIIKGCLAEEPPNRLGRARVLSAAVHIAVAACDLVAAAEAVQEMESLSDHFETPMLQAMAGLARGRLELAEGSPSSAAATLQAAARQWQELEVPYEVASATTLLGQAYRQTGDEGAARKTFASARELFESLGARLEANSFDFRRARTSQLPAGLTQREVQVLQLVAAGNANKEIAARLHLSAKTVSRHLTNIFNKLGVTSRAAATAFAYQHDLVSRR
jgi:ATP/maltotriose-dependent transcriptional regulator MalT